MRHLYTTILITFLGVSILKAQQYPLFSNFVVNNYGYNPATPAKAGTIGGHFVYRNQWVGIDQAPETSFAGIRGGLKQIPISVGGYFFSDKAGLMERKGGMARVAYTVTLAENTTLSAGIEAGTHSLSISQDYVVDDALDQLVADGIEKQNIPDLNIGLHFQREGLFIGLAFPQLLEKNLDFVGTQSQDQSRILRHYFAMAGYTYYLNEKVAIEPSAIVKVVKGAPTQFDASVRVLLNKFWIGGNYRHKDAIAALVGLNFKNFEVAYGYDVTTTNLNNYNSGGHEISVGFHFGGKADKDNDGIADSEDECPDEPGGKDSNGCPDDESLVSDNVEADDDKDGIPNSRDKCPTIAGLEVFNGCPLGDQDHDGIRDDIDKCPNLAGVASNNGCPIDDQDRDGIVDAYDKCPEVPGSILAEGCPSEDRDNDGVVDALDDCPDIAGPQYLKGCPITEAAESPAAKAVLRSKENITIRNVYFDTDKDIIRKVHFEELNKAAEFLVTNPAVKIRMSGHTDERASHDYNADLSKRRVESVMFYLINRGVKRKQIIADYYGEVEPADNRHEEPGWQLNRRVELELVFE